MPVEVYKIKMLKSSQFCNTFTEKFYKIRENLWNYYTVAAVKNKIKQLVKNYMKHVKLHVWSQTCKKHSKCNYFQTLQGKT